MSEIKDLLQNENYNFVSLEDKRFITEYVKRMDLLGYTCDNKIVDGICYGKYMMIFRKKNVTSKKVYSRLYFRKNGVVLRLFLKDSDVTKHSSYIETLPESIKSTFIGYYAKCNHCRGEDCKFRKCYYINNTSYEKCNGLTFEFFDVNTNSLSDYVNLFLKFYPSKKHNT